MRVAILLVAAALSACAETAAELSWSVCPVTRTADGREIDDGGVDVFANVRASRVRQIAAGHFPGACSPESGPLPALACGDPHVDALWRLAWTRRAPASLAVEVAKYDVPDRDDVAPPERPSSRRVVATVRLAPGARVTAGARLPCP